MKKIYSTAFAICFSLIFSTAMAVQFQHHAQVRGTKTYYSKHYTDGKMTVTEHHHPATPGTIKAATLEGVNHYAVDPDHEAIDWLNRNTEGDILSGGAPLYHTDTGEHHGLFELQPGFYHLNFINIDEVRQMQGYKDLKKLMGDRVQLVKPVGKGQYVGIRIYGSKDKVAADE